MLWTIKPWDEHVQTSGLLNLFFGGNYRRGLEFVPGDNAILILVGADGFYRVVPDAARHFDSHTLMGQIAFGLIFGGILGNLFDRIAAPGGRGFYPLLHRTTLGSTEIGFPAFNVADSAICIGRGADFPDYAGRTNAPLKNAPSGK